MQAKQIEPRKIETVKTKATYQVPIFKVTNNGLEQAGTTEIKFVKGSKADDTVFRQEGLMTETLISVAITYLKDNNIGDLENEHTTNAILHLETALYKLDQRAKERQNRGVQGTYNK